MRPPTFIHERELIALGHVPIGVDEAGCGCLAGPVVAAACVLPLDSRLGLIRDSKLLSRQQRERLLVEFRRRGYRWAIGSASVEEIDRLNIRQATYLAMERAVRAFLGHPSSRAESQRSREIPDRSEISPLHWTVSAKGECVHGAEMTEREENVPVEMTNVGDWFALVDAWTIPNLSIPQCGIIHGAGPARKCSGS